MVMYIHILQIANATFSKKKPLLSHDISERKSLVLTC
jgi:hypothetical protein